LVTSAVDGLEIIALEHPKAMTLIKGKPPEGYVTVSACVRVFSLKQQRLSVERLEVLKGGTANAVAAIFGQHSKMFYINHTVKKPVAQKTAERQPVAYHKAAKSGFVAEYMHKLPPVAALVGRKRCLIQTADIVYVIFFG
jgi:hypothetical protein